MTCSLFVRWWTYDSGWKLTVSANENLKVTLVGIHLLLMSDAYEETEVGWYIEINT
jgi:hypothetical protein